MRRKLIDYNEIQFMHGCAFEQDEQGRATPYSEILQYYCETAMDFVDLMKSNKFGIDEVPDFSFATFHTFVIGVALCQFENLELGMNVVDALKDVKNQMSGYFFFTLYNEAVRQDLEPKIYVNDDETGFILETEDDGPLGCVDIEESWKELSRTWISFLIRTAIASTVMPRRSLPDYSLKIKEGITMCDNNFFDDGFALFAMEMMEEEERQEELRRALEEAEDEDD